MEWTTSMGRLKDAILASWRHDSRFCLIFILSYSIASIPVFSVTQQNDHKKAACRTAISRLSISRPLPPNLRPVLFWPAAARPATLRPGFSLAEVMIAIGILGIGMLMVATTFPVGLDQTRIAMQETMAPLVSDEIYATLNLLLEDHSQRVLVGGSRYNLADLIRASATAPFADHLTDRIFVPGDSFDLNGWFLGTDPKAQGAPTPPATLYPSVLRSPTLAAHYSSALLYRFPKLPDASQVEVVAFVARGGLVRLEEIGAEPVPVQPTVIHIPDNPAKGYTGARIARELLPGTSIVAFDGSRYYVLSTAPTQAEVTVDRPFFPGAAATSTLPIWRVAPDASTGASPLIHVYSRNVRVP